MEYFIIDENNQQAGPFSLEQLAEKAITPETGLQPGKWQN